MFSLKRISILLTIFSLFLIICLISISDIAMAAMCIAECDNGESVSCSGTSCSSNDNVGCAAWVGGILMDVRSCGGG